jgi:hypothetical protein
MKKSKITSLGPGQLPGRDADRISRLPWGHEPP